jgi:nitroimidazol reductase NimA-like FMN-containing flavoprotein (pyridoxamine 5'-phosphate oxidase superfamily)
MIRSDRQMSDIDTRTYLREQCVAHVGTSDASGWPYVVPLMYVYESGNLLHLHTGPHQGHFLANIRANPRICIQVNETGPMHRGQPSPCNSALVYKSVIAYGHIQVVEGSGVNEKKTWFFDRLLERLNEPMSAYEKPGYPMLDRIILYEVELEMVTGKLNVGLHH